MDKILDGDYLAVVSIKAPGRGTISRVPAETIEAIRKVEGLVLLFKIDAVFPTDFLAIVNLELNDLLDLIDKLASLEGVESVSYSYITKIEHDHVVFA